MFTGDSKYELVYYTYEVYLSVKKIKFHAFSRKIYFSIICF